ncbi:ataxin-10 [Brachionichthys hirsutus]|uniref:ataxin-10 n=1 Tax=Brachionichthys hirsutus TaxID=412623 RepID=UPI003605030A
MAASADSGPDSSAALSRILNEKRCPEHLQVLKTFSTAFRGKENRDAAEEEVFSGLFKVVSGLCDDLQAVGIEARGLQLQLTAECFRALRNACVQNSRNQNVLRELGFIEASVRILSCLQSSGPDSRCDRCEPLRCGIQFLGNLAVANQTCKDDIWRLTFPDLILKLLHVADDTAVNYASMVLHTCLDEAKAERLSEPQNLPVALRVMALCRTRSDLDWTVLVATEHLLKSSSLVESLYAAMPHLERVALLKLILARLKEDPDRWRVAPGVARFLSGAFQKGCGAVLTLAVGSASSDEVVPEVLTVTSLLDVLCEMTSDHEQFMFLQNDPGLLAATVALLGQVHAVGKAGGNVFSAAQDFSSFGEDSSSDSPVVSFKAHLIRLIGNLCHGNAGNQDKVRELEGLALILDNCNIDSNNPFIGQWAVFAIRNLLEHNQQNQRLVAALEARGAADYSALGQLGFQVEQRDGTLLLRPTSKDC